MKGMRQTSAGNGRGRALAAGTHLA
jgi:hypothetical protein